MGLLRPGNAGIGHADRGTSMASKTVTAMISELDVTKVTLQAPESKDNPLSEAGFKILKFAPVFTERFAGLGDARRFMNEYLGRALQPHTGVGLNTVLNVSWGGRIIVRNSVAC